MADQHVYLSPAWRDVGVWGQILLFATLKKGSGLNNQHLH